MLQITYDIKMPNNCVCCPLMDDEFDYCHGHIADNCAWELTDYQHGGKPNWCPLKEIKKVEEK